MGGLVQDFFSTIVDISSTSALIVSSVCPGNFLTLHTVASPNKTFEYIQGLRLVLQTENAA
jgi:hypothetical protein